jgi:hypothetical protein
MLEEGAKCVPETLTESPTIPDEGVSVMLGIATVNVAVPVREPMPTVPVTVNV